MLMNGMSIFIPLFSFGALLLQHEHDKPTPAKSNTNPITGLTISMLLVFFLLMISTTHERGASVQ